MAKRRGVEGVYVYGAKFIAFKPNGGEEYIKIAKCIKGQRDNPIWLDFAEKVVRLLNDEKV
jgi:hypothetical protein